MSRKDDLISRQAAIEVLELAIADDWEFGYAKDRMNELPSVQPEIIRCKDYKYTDDDFAVEQKGKNDVPTKNMENVRTGIRPE